MRHESSYSLKMAWIYYHNPERHLKDNWSYLITARKEKKKKDSISTILKFSYFSVDNFSDSYFTITFYNVLHFSCLNVHLAVSLTWRTHPNVTPLEDACATEI